MVPAFNNSNRKKFFLMSRFVLFISRLNIDEFNLVLTVEAEFNLSDMLSKINKEVKKQKIKNS